MSLIAHYPLHEESGTTAHDLENGNDGDIVGATPAGAVGIGGMPAYSFDGTDDYIDLHSVWGRESVYSLSGWVRPDSTAAGVIHDQRDLWGLTYSPNGNQYLNIFTYGNSYVFPTEPIPVGEWSHLYAAWDQSDSRIYFYKNGGLVDSLSYTDGINNTSNMSTLGSGTDGTSPTGHFSGELSQVRLHNRLLAPAEVATLHEAGDPYAVEQATTHPAAVREGGVARYSMDTADVSDDGTTLYEAWNANDATIYGAAPGVAGVGGGEAFSFDGVDDSIECGFTHPETTEWSISAWVRTNSDHNGIIVSGWAGNDPNNSFQLKKKSGGQFRLFLKTGSSSRHNLDSEPWENGVLTHVAATYDHSIPSQSLYINGVEVASGAAQIQGDSGVNWMIGQIEGFNYFDGEIDEVRVYDRALGPAAVWQLYGIGRNHLWRTIHQ